MNTTYALKVQAANDPSAPADNWWSATLTNKKTNESVTIGRLKAFGNSFNDQLASLETTVFYNGEKKACDAVPVMDLVVLPRPLRCGCRELIHRGPVQKISSLVYLR